MSSELQTLQPASGSCPQELAWHLSQAIPSVSGGQTHSPVTMWQMCPGSRHSAHSVQKQYNSVQWQKCFKSSTAEYGKIKSSTAPEFSFRTTLWNLNVQLFVSVTVCLITIKTENQEIRTWVVSWWHEVPHLDNQLSRIRSIQQHIHYKNDQLRQACKNTLQRLDHSRYLLLLSGCRHTAGSQVPGSGPTHQPTLHTNEFIQHQTKTKTQNKKIWIWHIHLLVKQVGWLLAA